LETVKEINLELNDDDDDSTSEIPENILKLLEAAGDLDNTESDNGSDISRTLDEIIHSLEIDDDLEDLSESKDEVQNDSTETVEYLENYSEVAETGTRKELVGDIDQTVAKLDNSTKREEESDRLPRRSGKKGVYGKPLSIRKI